MENGTPMTKEEFLMPNDEAALAATEFISH